MSEDFIFLCVTLSQWQNSGNSKTSVTILLIQSVLICILSEVFVMEMLELCCQYPGRGQPDRHVFAVAHNSLKKTDTFMPLTHISNGRYIILNEEVSDYVFADALNSDR
jgi:hypothetical protein